MKFGLYFPPMLLEEVEAPFDSSSFLFEPKYDGIRVEVHVSKTVFKIFSRNGQDVTYLFPELKSLSSRFLKETILDGEVVLFFEGLPNFSKLQTRLHTKDKNKINRYAKMEPVCFMAFDCLFYDKDITHLSLLKRKQVLENFADSDNFIKVSYVLEKGKKLFQKIKKLDMEGIVAKKIDSTYEINVRTNNWLKIKNYKIGEFLVGGYVIKKDVISLCLGEYINNKFVFVGKVTMGKKGRFYKELWQAKKKNKTPFQNFLDRDCIYIEPVLKCKVAYLERTKNNNLRTPIFKGGTNL